MVNKVLKKMSTKKHNRPTKKNLVMAETMHLSPVGTMTVGFGRFVNGYKFIDIEPHIDACSVSFSIDELESREKVLRMRTSYELHLRGRCCDPIELEDEDDQDHIDDEGTDKQIRKIIQHRSHDLGLFKLIGDSSSLSEGHQLSIEEVWPYASFMLRMACNAAQRRFAEHGLVVVLNVPRIDELELVRTSKDSDR